MNTENLIKDYMQFKSSMIDDKQSPGLKGILYEEVTDDYGQTILQKVNSNTVVIGGAILALEHLTGATTCWKPATLNSIYNINTELSATVSDLDSRICLFGIGIGGSDLKFGDIVDPQTKQRDILEPIPFRYGLALTGKNTDKYHFKITEQDGSTFKWMLKEFSDTPLIRSQWKDSIEDDVDGTEINSEIYDSTKSELLQSFAEYKIEIDYDDVYEYFKAIGELKMGRYNTIGLYTANKVQLENGDYDYVNIRLYACVTFNNRDASVKTHTTYRYRVYSLT